MSYFSADAPVASQSVSDRKKASADALERVLIRVSGITDLSSVPALAQAKRSPERFVQQFSFKANPQPDESAQILSVSFSPTSIKGLLRQAGLPFWPLNRPNALAWLAEDSATEGRQIVTDPLNPVLAGLLDVANLRGIPLTLPLMDLQDQLAVGPDQVWALEEEAIAVASERYNTDTILVGKYSVTSTGSILSTWQYVHRNVRRSLDFRTQDLSLTGAKAVNALADHLSGLYAVRANTEVNGRAFFVEVTQIFDYQDFDAMLMYLKNLALVDQLQLNRTQDDRVYLNMTLKGDESQLENALALDGRLKLLPAPFQAINQKTLAGISSTIGLDPSSGSDIQQGATLPQQMLPTLRFEWVHTRL